MQRHSASSPLLSIVIPTRNRIPYAISAIESILNIPDPRLELVIQDNSDSSELQSYIRHNIADGRLRYQYTPHPFSMTDNFNAAVELATGEYLCLIGDDDGVNPEIIEAAAWAMDNDLDALALRPNVNYLWRGTGISSTLFTKVTGGTLSITGLPGPLVEGDMKNGLRDLVRNGGVRYMDFDLPKLYHGLVRRKCLSAIWDRTGAYFGGLSPDVFTAVAIACVASRLAITDYPLTIPGACPGSGSTDTGKRVKSRRLEDATIWRGRRDYCWSELIPRTYTPETVWADSAVAALRAMGREDLVRELDLTRLAAHCISNNPDVVKTVLSGMFHGLRVTGRSPVCGALRFIWNLITHLGANFYRRAWNRFLMVTRKLDVCRIDGLESMNDVSEALTRYLRQHGCSFTECIRCSRMEGRSATDRRANP